VLQRQIAVLAGAVVVKLSLERAEFVLDHKSFFEGPHGLTHPNYSLYRWCKSTAGHKVGVVMHKRTRDAGAVASNPAEFLTAEGTQAGDEYADWGGNRDPHWEGARLMDAPRGFEEALAKRQACPTKGQGHLMVRHFDKNGKEEVKFIQPKTPVDQSSKEEQDDRAIEGADPKRKRLGC